MMKRSLGHLVGLIASGLSHPATLFGGATAAVFLTALTASWWSTSNAQAQVVGGLCRPSAGMRCVAPGANPCNSTSCQPTGSGYTCNIGAGVNVPEVNWTLQSVNTNSWPLCSAVTSSGPSCGGFWQICGTTLHYPSKDTMCTVTCAGTWRWLGCQAVGTPCTSGTGGGGVGG